MNVLMVTVPPNGSVKETVVDRRTGDTWSIQVEPFQIATTVVTEKQWSSVHDAASPAPPPDIPKVGVSWRDAVTFCNALSHQEGLPPAYTITQLHPSQPKHWRPHSEPATDDWLVQWNRTADGYRLPTDAEWQVACRAGTEGPRYAPLDIAGWYEANSGGQLQPVGRKQPNPWGLYDSLGGTWEWCWDLYDQKVYGSYRIIRGGGWNDPHWSCRAGVRRKTNPQASLDDLGFRLARNLPT